MKNIQAIIFDLDNTLLHFDDYWEASVKETFVDFHLTKLLDKNDLFQVYLQQDVILVELFDAGKITLEELRTQRLMETLSLFNLEATKQDCDHFQKSYVENAYLYIKPNKVYTELLYGLSKKYMLAIMSNGSSDFQREKLRRTGLDQYVHHEHIFISEEMGSSKPSLAIYQSALVRMNVNAEEVLFVGDSLGNDVIGPMRAGMQAVWVNKDGAAPSGEDVTFAIIKDVIELNDMLLKE